MDPSTIGAVLARRPCGGAQAGVGERLLAQGDGGGAHGGEQGLFVGGGLGLGAEVRADAVAEF